MKRAFFLDRDGVVNKSLVVNGLPRPPREINEIEILPGVKEAINILVKFEFEIVVVTNQPDVARGNQSKTNVELINAYISEATKIQHFYTCYHDDLDRCSCRKPKPGLITLAAAQHGIDLTESYLIGDRYRDIHAGQSAGCKTFFIDYFYPEIRPKKPYIKVSSLLQAVEIVTGVLNGK